MGLPLLREWAERFSRTGGGGGAAFALLVRWGKTSASAAECVCEVRQEALARALKQYEDSPERFRDFDHFANTVTRIMLNWIRDERKRQRGIVGVFDDELTAPEYDPRPEIVQRALEQLAEEDRALITGHVIDERSLDQLAERFLPSPEGTPNARRLRVRRLLLHALERLRAKYDENDTD